MSDFPTDPPPDGSWTPRPPAVPPPLPPSSPGDGRSSAWDPAPGPPGTPPGSGYPPPASGYPPPGTGYPPPGTGYPPPGSGYPPPGAGYPPGFGGYPGPGYGYPHQVEHPQGTTVLVLGILSLVFCGLAGPFAWSMGTKALRDIDASPTTYSNRSAVVAGRIMGIVASAILVLIVLFFVFVVVVGLLGSSAEPEFQRLEDAVGLLGGRPA